MAGAVDDPTIRIGVTPNSWKLEADGSYRSNGDDSGTWQAVDNGYVLTSNPYTVYSILGCNTPRPNARQQNLDCDYVVANDLDRMSVETSAVTIVSMGVLEKGAQHWRLAMSYRTELYAAGDYSGVALDPSKPIEVYQGEIIEIDILAPTTPFLPFSAFELLGTWSIDFLNRDNIDAAAYCDREQCSDLITFNANQTAYLELSGRSVGWQLTPEGNVRLLFADTGNEMIISRVALGADTSTVLQQMETDSDYYTGLRMLVKRDAPAPTDITSLYGSLLSSAFNVTSTDPYYRRSSIDNGIIDNFAFMLNEDGTGNRHSIFSVTDIIENTEVVNGYISQRDITWDISGNRLTSYLCYIEAELDGQPYCLYEQSRAWDLLKITDSRLYVHETLSVTSDWDLDGEQNTEWSVSRTNFYAMLDYYDLNDVDRDGYANDDDAFPTDETEWADSNNNGIGDNNDPANDDDGDGVPNGQDAFPDNAAASVDSDGDGYPDSWNAEAANQIILDSGLVLDAFPDDPSEAIDTDGDGIGNNADTDDDNDGWSDEEEASEGSSPTDANDYPSTSGLNIILIKAALDAIASQASP